MKCDGELDAGRGAGPLAVIGLGYVGLPVALAAARAHGTASGTAPRRRRPLPSAPLQPVRLRLGGLLLLQAE
ncbi:MAG TPA: hypothetical protein QF730_08670, partial [Planctomycetota bacterium]|nr:hypothetical protein [Planctomycetota bacterium]